LAKPLVAALNATQAPAQPAPPAVQPVHPRPAATPAPPPVAAPPVAGSETRKWERVPLAGTKAYAVLSTHPEQNARVVDLSYGGVALQMDPTMSVPGSFQAVLHVPILPPVKVQLRKVYEYQETNQQLRLGCAFIS
jgi:hypothetical protein